MIPKITKNPKSKAKLKDVKKIKSSQNVISLQTKIAETKIVKLLETIKGLNGEIIEISVHKPTLEDVFLHFTGRSIKDDT